MSAQGGVCLLRGCLLNLSWRVSACEGVVSVQGVSVGGVVSAQGGVCLLPARGCQPSLSRGVSAWGVSAGGCLPGGCLSSLSRGCLADSPLVDRILDPKILPFRNFV